MGRHREVAVQPRRERWAIVRDILLAIDAQDQTRAVLRLTHVAHQANLPLDRLRTYLDQLAARGLIEALDRPRLTPEAREFLRHCRDWSQVVDALRRGE